MRNDGLSSPDRVCSKLSESSRESDGTDDPANRGEDPARCEKIYYRKNPQTGRGEFRPHGPNLRASPYWDLARNDGRLLLAFMEAGSRPGPRGSCQHVLDNDDLARLVPLKHRKKPRAKPPRSPYRSPINRLRTTLGEILLYRPTAARELSELKAGLDRDKLKANRELARELGKRLIVWTDSPEKKGWYLNLDEHDIKILGES